MFPHVTPIAGFPCVIIHDTLPSRSGSPYCLQLRHVTVLKNVYRQCIPEAAMIGPHYCL